MGNLFAIRHRDGFYYPNAHIDGTSNPVLYNKIGQARALITRLIKHFGRDYKVGDFKVVEFELREVAVSNWGTKK